MFTNANGFIRKYLVNITEVETQKLIVTDSTDVMVTVQLLHPFYHYKCIVSAVTIELGPWSKPILIQLPEAGENTSVK